MWSREWYLGVVSFRAWRALILSYASTNIRLTATAAFVHCVYVCQYEGMRDQCQQHLLTLTTVFCCSCLGG